MIKKCEAWRIEYKYRDYFLEDDLIEYKCLYQHKFDEKLKEKFFNTYKFSDHDNYKLILLLWKGVYHYEYMDDWEKINETSLPQKKKFFTVT